MTKRILSLVLAVVLAVSLLAGCSGNPSSSASDSGSSSGSEAENFNKEGFPIVNETITLKGFGGRAPEDIAWEEVENYKEYEKMTNIHIEWELADVENIEEVRNIKLASGDLPDLFFQARMPVLDQIKYGQMGYFVPLNDLIKNYAPNLQYILDNEPDVKKVWTMTDGNIYGISGAVASDNTVNLMPQKWWISLDYVNEYNDGKIPATTDELYTFLKAVKDANPEMTPLSSHRLKWIIRAMKGSFGMGNRSAYSHEYVSWDEENQTVVLDATTENYKEMLQYMNKLYTEGILDPNIFTQEMASYVANGLEGKYCVIHGNTPGVFGFPMNEEDVNPEDPLPYWNTDGEGGWSVFHFAGPNGDDLMSCQQNPVNQPGQFVITKNNQYPEATIRWVDYFMDGGEGTIFYYYGIEGNGYDINPETGTRANTGTKYDKATTGKQYTFQGSYPVWYWTADVYNFGVANPTANERYLDMMEELSSTKLDSTWGAFAWTEEEADEISILQTDIEGYVEEIQAKLITGEMSFDQWDEIQTKIKNMGLDRYIEIYTQAALRLENQQ